MSCDHCDKPAVVHEVHIRNGKMSEVHLCVEHARAAGKLPGVAPTIAGAAPETMLSEEAASTGRSAPKLGRTGVVCRCCGLAFHELRQGGLLGCPDCYEQFGATLAKIIERAQSGAVHHVGKTPRRGGGMIDLHAVRQRLVRELELAVAAEQYERAAKLRDRILTLAEPASPAEPAGGRLGATESPRRVGEGPSERGGPERASGSSEGLGT